MEEKKTKYTQEGYNKLVEEYDFLVNVRRKQVKEQLKEARSFGDLSENSEYDEARETQAKVESRIFDLENLMKNAEIVDSVSGNEVYLGTTVEIKYLATGKVVKYSIVGSNEVDPINHKISDQSPIGAALLGRKKGEVITVETPVGEKEIEIVKLSKTK